MAPIFVWEQEEALYTKGPLKFEEPALHVRRPLLLWQKFVSIQVAQVPSKYTKLKMFLPNLHESI
jgi:hypothetical protein